VAAVVLEGLFTEALPDESQEDLGRGSAGEG
jgi:hypothetical protein